MTTNEVSGTQFTEDSRVPEWTIVLAFATVYLVWGSTYLGIKVAIETIPPFYMAAGRFIIAGSILYVIARINGAAAPGRQQWAYTALTGVFLIAGGNGLVSLAETWIDSSMAALITASGPFIMTLFSWWGGVENRPTGRIWLSLAGGFAGVVLLIGSAEGGDSLDFLWGCLLVLVAVVLWTVASIYSKRSTLKIDIWLQSALQMFCGGLACLFIAYGIGEFEDFDISTVSARSWWAFVYLVIMGSLVGFTAYVFLLKHRSPSAVASHAYVNPVVAVILGWLILGETLTLWGLIGSGVILISVVEILRRR